MATEMDALRLRIERLMHERGRSARSLSLAIGQNPAYIQQLITGMRNKKPPSIEIMEAIADELGVPLDVLRGRVPENAAVKPRLTKQELLRRIGAYPIIDLSTYLDQAVSAGKGNKANIPQGLEAIADMEIIPLPDGQTLYALRVTGDCMEPNIEPGDTVRFDPEVPAEDGDLVVAAQDGDKALIKWLDKRASLQRLISLNGDPIIIDDRIEIVGVVKDIVKPPPPKPRRKVAPKPRDGQLELPEP